MFKKELTIVLKKEDDYGCSIRDLTYNVRGDELINCGFGYEEVTLELQRYRQKSGDKYDFARYLADYIINNFPIKETTHRDGLGYTKHYDLSLYTNEHKKEIEFLKDLNIQYLKEKAMCLDQNIELIKENKQLTEELEDLKNKSVFKLAYERILEYFSVSKRPDGTKNKPKEGMPPPPPSQKANNGK